LLRDVTPLDERSELLRFEESDTPLRRFEDAPDSLPRLELVDDPDNDWFERLEPLTSGERVLRCEVVLRRDDERFGCAEFDRGATEFRLPEYCLPEELLF
jgi:hypothetical protein